MDLTSPFGKPWNIIFPVVARSFGTGWFKDKIM
jgi:hypothetical protein